MENKTRNPLWRFGLIISGVFALFSLAIGLLGWAVLFTILFTIFIIIDPEKNETSINSKPN